jgi:hypothetical protein
MELPLPVHPKFLTTNLYLHIEIHEANLDQNKIKLDFGTPTTIDIREVS